MYQIVFLLSLIVVANVVSLRTDHFIDNGLEIYNVANSVRFVCKNMRIDWGSVCQVNERDYVSWKNGHGGYLVTHAHKGIINCLHTKWDPNPHFSGVGFIGSNYWDCPPSTTT